MNAVSDREILVRVPASTANLGSGFDTIGMALQLYATIRMRVAEKTRIRLIGPHLNGLPADENNLIYRVAEQVFRLAGVPMPNIEIEVESDIPLTRGLGSSASAIVGGLVAANELAGCPFSHDEILKFAASREGHADNVAAALFGGIVITAMDGENVSYVRISPPDNLKAVVAIPDFQLPTAEARRVLPSSYSREDAVYAISRAALLAAALASGNTTVLHEAMKDRLHQPYRIKLVPGLEEILKGARRYGALGAALSGAGPAVLALTEGPDEPLKEFMKTAFLKNGINCQTLTLFPDLHGVVVKEEMRKISPSLPHRSAAP